MVKAVLNVSVLIWGFSPWSPWTGGFSELDFSLTCWRENYLKKIYMLDLSNCGAWDMCFWHGLS